MAVAAVNMESRIAELSDGAFEAFCGDIAGMFDANVTCERQETGIGTTEDLRKHFKKLAAVHHIEATGTLDGTFHLFFDQGGLFVLSGVVVMLPESRIRDEVNRGSIKDTENLTDVCREVGNLLVGSWDRVFRENCEGHEHFVKTGTFIGFPWENPDELSLTQDEEFVFVVYHMTVEPYPRFTCAVVFPKQTLIPPPAASPEPDQDADDEEQEEQPEDEPQATAQQENEPPQAAEPAEVSSDTEAEPPQDSQPEPQDIPGLTDLGPDVLERPAPVNTADTTDVPETVDDTEPRGAGDTAEPPQIPQDIRTVVETVVGDIGEDAAVYQPSSPPLSEPVGAGPSFTESVFADALTHAPDKGITETLETRALEIMDADVVWCKPDDSVQNVMEKMQRHNTGYVLVGANGVLEGIVSNSNLLGAVSPYLRPMFAQWRRSEDDATLQIKIKWIMSRPVRTVTPDTTLGSLAETMRRYGGRCLPVVDNQGKVQGIITVFDIMLRFLQAGHAFSWKGKPPQGPPLLI